MAQWCTHLCRACRRQRRIALRFAKKGGCTRHRFPTEERTRRHPGTPVAADSLRPERNPDWRAVSRTRAAIARFAGGHGRTDQPRGTVGNRPDQRAVDPEPVRSIDVCAVAQSVCERWSAAVFRPGLDGPGQSDAGVSVRVWLRRTQRAFDAFARQSAVRAFCAPPVRPITRAVGGPRVHPLGLRALVFRCGSRSLR